MVIMKINKMIQKLVENQFEFELKWIEYEEDRYIGYSLCIILGNREYIINVDDKKGLKNLWNEIEKYYIV